MACSRLRHTASVLGAGTAYDPRRAGTDQPSSCGASATSGAPPLVLRDLKKSPLRIADLMLGCAFNTVSDNRDGLMAAAEQDAIATVIAAVEAGIHEMDVSASYGAGRSEEYVGSGLLAAGVPSGPSWIDVWSKGGPELIRQKNDTTQTVGRGYAGERVNLRDFSAAGARAAFAESTARLGLERLAGFRIHDPSPDDVDTALGPDGFVAGLVAMRNEGLIGQVSLGELTELMLRCCLRQFSVCPPGALLLCPPNIWASCIAAHPCTIECCVSFSLSCWALRSQRRNELQPTSNGERHHAISQGGAGWDVQHVSAGRRLEFAQPGLLPHHGRGATARRGDPQRGNLQHGALGRRRHLCVSSSNSRSCRPVKSCRLLRALEI